MDAMQGDAVETYPQAWVRAALDLAILSCLTAGPRHGYALAVQLQDAGMGRLRGGSLYPALARLEEAGWVAASWAAGPAGPGRKEYALTDDGRHHQSALTRHWRAFTDTLLNLGHPEGEGR